MLTFRYLTLKTTWYIAAMSGQQKISNFFTTAVKRPPTETADQNTPPKKQKNIEPVPPINGQLSPDQNKLKSPINGQLSPEQKDRMEQNKVAALGKLHAKKTNGLLVNFGNSWYKVLEAEFSKPYFSELSKFVESERNKHTVYPPANEVFMWTKLCDVNDIKVVILGQDPYHGPKQAHGLCFSVQKDVRPPPSLENMYKELASDIDGFKHPGHGTLTGWAKQGVLLLNACLTVRAHQANSHKDKGWEKVTDAVISWLNKNKSGLVFILWGSYAQKKGGFIDKKKHLILKGVHPSPLSAHRGFFGCKHFSKCNDYLKEHGKKVIDWNDLPPQE